MTDIYWNIIKPAPFCLSGQVWSVVHFCKLTCIQLMFHQILWCIAQFQEFIDSFHNNINNISRGSDKRISLELTKTYSCQLSMLIKTVTKVIKYCILKYKVYIMNVDKTQVVGESWWWDPWIGSQPNLSWVCNMNERFGWNPIKGAHESRSTHSLGFVFILWCSFWIYFHFLKVFIFFGNAKDFFSMVHITVVVASSQQAKWSISLPDDITVNTHGLVTMGRCHCLGNYVTSQWVGDVAIDIKQSCDQQPGSFIQETNGRKTWTILPQILDLDTHHMTIKELCSPLCSWYLYREYLVLRLYYSFELWTFGTIGTIGYLVQLAFDTMGVG